MITTMIITMIPVGLYTVWFALGTGVHFNKVHHNLILINVPPLIPDGDPNAFGSPDRMNGGKFTIIIFLS